MAIDALGDPYVVSSPFLGTLPEHATTDVLLLALQLAEPLDRHAWDGAGNSVRPLGDDAVVLVQLGGLGHDEGFRRLFALEMAARIRRLPPADHELLVVAEERRGGRPTPNACRCRWSGGRGGASTVPWQPLDPSGPRVLQLALCYNSAYVFGTA